MTPHHYKGESRRKKDRPRESRAWFRAWWTKRLTKQAELINGATPDLLRELLPSFIEDTKYAQDRYGVEPLQLARAAQAVIA